MFDLLVAITIVLSIKVIGTILVVALMVIPGLCALKLNLSFKKTLISGVAFSIVSTTVGIFFLRIQYCNSRCYCVCFGVVFLVNHIV